MISVEIHSVKLNEKYDFVVDENLSVSLIIEEIAQMLTRHDRLTLSGDVRQFCLYSKKDGRVLSAKNSLYDHGVITGDVLYIV